jgi:hypothetical protein
MRSSHLPAEAYQVHSQPASISRRPAAGKWLPKAQQAVLPFASGSK